MARTSIQQLIRGADDVYLAKGGKSIGIRRVSSTHKNGKFVMNDVTRYVKASKANKDAVKKVYGYIRKGR